MKIWKCEKCGLEVLAFEKPTLVHWTEGKECSGRFIAEVAAKDGKMLGHRVDLESLYWEI